MAQETLTVDTDKHPSGSIINLLTQEGVSIEATVTPGAQSSTVSGAQFQDNVSLSAPVASVLGPVSADNDGGYGLIGDGVNFTVDADSGVMTYIGAASRINCEVTLSVQAGNALARANAGLAMFAIAQNNDLVGTAFFDPQVLTSGGAPATFPVNANPPNYVTIVSRRMVSLTPGDELTAVCCVDVDPLDIRQLTLTARI